MRLTALSILTGIVIALPGRGAPVPPAKAAPTTAEQLQTSAKNLDRIALAIHSYVDAHGAMPTNQISKDKKPLLSWRVQLLASMEREPRPLAAPGMQPDIEFADLFKAFKLDEPWDSENNKKLIEKMPKVYAPVRGKAPAGTTFYQAFGGAKGWLKTGAQFPLSFPDGTSNTFLVAEGAEPVIWTKPDDLVFDGKTVPALGGMFEGRFHAAMADGSVMRFRKDVDAATLRLLIDPADGTPLPADIGEEVDEKK